ncbi:MAG: hypothetical protein ACO1QB_08255 [Verrucomicrobiales bacterium]
MQQRSAAPSRLGSFLSRLMIFTWKFLAGAGLTQTLLGSILLSGWTYRASQRRIFKKWWEASSLSKEQDWATFAAQDINTAPLLHWPNWIIAQNGQLQKNLREKSTPGKFRRCRKAAWASLKANFILGIQGIFNTLVLTLPGCALMAFAWYAGWLNSFNKGYEHAPVGPFMWISGALLFAAAMFYVPMAQMRQASTGNWRSFYQFKLVWKIIRQSWAPAFALALLYTAVSLPFMVLKIVPGFFPQINPALVEVTPERALEISQQYFFWCGALLFPALLMLRLVAARIYASSMLALVQNGSISEYELGDAEWITLHRLNHLEVRPQPSRHYLIKAAGWIGTRMGRAVSSLLLILIWFSFVSQVLISEFFIKTDAGWLNQPLVQFPMFNYTPSQLKEGLPNI